MYKNIIIISVILINSHFCFGQKVNFKDGYPNGVNPIGILKNIPDSTVLEIVQRQTFRLKPIIIGITLTKPMINPISAKAPLALKRAPLADLAFEFLLP